MDVNQLLGEYEQEIKSNGYVYSLQKQGVHLLYSFLNHYQSKSKDEKRVLRELDYFLNIWIPRNKRYLTSIQAFNIAYTVHDFKRYIEKKCNTEIAIPQVLESHANEYKRLYEARQVLRKMIGDPVISVDPFVIDLKNYRHYKEKKTKKQNMCMYEQGLFVIEEVSREGYLGLKKLKGDRYCKVLCQPHQLAYFKIGDILHGYLKRKVFFIYWEIEDLRTYYTQGAYPYLE